jgi:hypothetical protein
VPCVASLVLSKLHGEHRPTTIAAAQHGALTIIQVSQKARCIGGEGPPSEGHNKSHNTTHTLAI